MDEKKSSINEDTKRRQFEHMMKEIDDSDSEEERSFNKSNADTKRPIQERSRAAVSTIEISKRLPSEKASTRSFTADVKLSSASRIKTESNLSRRKQSNDSDSSSSSSSDEEGHASSFKSNQSTTRKNQSETLQEFRRMAVDSFGSGNEAKHQIQEMDVNAMKEFVLRPVAKGEKLIQCYIKRDRSGTKKINPIYSLYLEDGDQFLLSAQKRIKNRTSNYLIALDGNPSDRKSKRIIGKVRSNWSGSEYTLYDDGLNPTKTQLTSNVRKALGICSFAYDKMGPGKLTAYIPRVNEAGNPLVFKETTENASDSIHAAVESKSHTKLMFLRNKRPKYDEKAGGHVLNFHGRVTMSSVKNFQLLCDDTEDETVLQFGRISCQPPGPETQCECHKHIFNLDFKYPMSPLQAFAIVLCTMDGKIADSKGFEALFGAKEKK